MNSPRLLRLHPADNVLTVVCPAEAGTRLEFEGMKMHITQPVGLGHKVAARPIAAGEKVLKYGVAIGSATRSIDAGEHVHTHNLKSDYLPTWLRETQGEWFAAKNPH